MATEFDIQLAKDVKDIFLTGDFSVVAKLDYNSVVTEIQVQFFEEPLDKTGATFYHAWCAFEDIPVFEKNKATLEIDSIVYGIVDYSPDENQLGVDLFLQKV